MKTSKVLQSKKVSESERKYAAQTKNIMDWEKTQELKAMTKDNWFVLLFGVFLGFVLGVISHLGRV